MMPSVGLPCVIMVFPDHTQILFYLLFMLYFQAHMGNLRLMTNIGYGISLVSLTVAVFLMLYFK